MERRFRRQSPLDGGVRATRIQHLGPNVEETGDESSEVMELPRKGALQRREGESYGLDERLVGAELLLGRSTPQHPDVLGLEFAGEFLGQRGLPLIPERSASLS